MMRGRIVFLLEERSMKVLLDEWLPRIFTGWVEREHFLCIPHEGKSDLEKSMLRKLRSWHIANDRFVIVRDNDNAECRQLKMQLQVMCRQAGRADTMIRLVCQELESWYLGDLAALSSAFGVSDLDTPKLRKKFAKPDDWQKPSMEVKRLVPAFQKISGARAMSRHLASDGNTSSSFRVFVESVRRLAAEASSE